MKLEDIQQLWETDSDIDRTELGEESLRIPQLHSKYFKLYSNERLVLKKYQADYKQLYKDKFQYYNGTLDEETLRERQWEPNPLKILRTDIPVHIDGDKELQLIQMKIDIQEEKITFLESAIKSLTNRGFQIKAAIDWAKFQNGA
jgi:hypothetical protein